MTACQLGPAAKIESTFVSVVVCTRNRSQLLANSLRSLGQLQSDETFDFEIVVVDNASNDDTAQVVAAVKREIDVPFTYCVESQVGIVHARNRGIDESHGDWIAYFDDDQLADSQWLIELLRCARQRHALFVGGQVQLQQSAPQQRKLGRLCRDLLSENVESTERQYDRRFKPSTGNLMVHRFALDLVDRFQEHLDNRGEDTLLYLKLAKFGVPGWHNPAAIVYHVIPESRLTDGAFIEMARFVGARMPRLEKYHWRSMFPLVWLARAAKLLVLAPPRYWLAKFSGDADDVLEAKCRCQMTAMRVRHGFDFLFTPTDQLFPDSQLS